MERITQYLKEDEKILWECHQRSNLLFFPILIFLFSIFFFLINFFTTFPNLIFSKNPSTRTIFFFWFWNVGTAIFLFIGFYSIFKKKKNTQLKFKNFSKYENIFVLTNKRYIQKVYYQNLHVKESLYSKEALEKHGDIVFVNLDYIKTFIVDQDGIVEFTMDYRDDILDPSYKATWLGLEFTGSISDYYDPLIDQLFKLIPFEKVKEDEYATYYRRKENERK